MTDCVLGLFLREPEASLLAIADKISEIPTKQLVELLWGLQVRVPDGCQRGVLQELVELAERLPGIYCRYSDADVHITTVGFIEDRLQRVDTSFITCPDCHTRITRTKHLLATFRWRLWWLTRHQSSPIDEQLGLPSWADVIRQVDDRPRLSVEGHAPEPAEFCRRSRPSSEFRDFLENGVLQRYAWWFDLCLGLAAPAEAPREPSVVGMARVGFIPRSESTARLPHLRGEPRIRGPDWPPGPVEEHFDARRTTFRGTAAAVIWPMSQFEQFQPRSTTIRRLNASLLV